MWCIFSSLQAAIREGFYFFDFDREVSLAIVRKSLGTRFVLAFARVNEEEI